MIDFGYYNMDCINVMKEFSDKYYKKVRIHPTQKPALYEWIFGLTPEQIREVKKD